MYKDFFQLASCPFDLSPDPDYLFLTRQHQEALAHLLYGISHRKGFVLITGEVGTGKTTLCRALLDEISPDTRAALILNPFLSDSELLQAILTEFGISWSGTSKSDLLEALNSFLLESHARGDNVVLVVDEAQHLSPQSLEQLRMLSNLETTKEKLIQIILVGQPELRGVLARPSMSQLNQRFTVRYHIGPLSLEDTLLYIQHRLRRAQAPERLSFLASAVQSIYTYAGGVPRVVNAICERSLLVASLAETWDITPQIVAQAAGEVGASPPPQQETTNKVAGARLPWFPQAAAALAVVLCLVVAGMELHAWFSRSDDAGVLSETEQLSTEVKVVRESVTKEEVELPIEVPQLKERVATEQKAVVGQQSSVVLAANTEVEEPDVQFASLEQQEQLEPDEAQYTKGFDNHGIFRCAPEDQVYWAAVLTMLRWHGVDSVKLNQWWSSAPRDLDVFLLNEGWRISRLPERWNRVKDLGLPVLLELNTATDTPEWVVWVGEHQGVDWFASPLEGMVADTQRELPAHWNGKGLLTIPNEVFSGGILRMGHQGYAVAAVQSWLQALGAGSDDTRGNFGASTRRKVQQFQQQYQLAVDGIAGPETLTWLYGKWWQTEGRYGSSQSGQQRVAQP